jgi:hypothetical protein
MSLASPPEAIVPFEGRNLARAKDDRSSLVYDDESVDVGKKRTIKFDEQIGNALVLNDR